MTASCTRWYYHWNWCALPANWLFQLPSSGGGRAHQVSHVAIITIFPICDQFIDLISFTTTESGVRDETQTLPAVLRSRTRRRNRPSRRPAKTSTTSTFLTTTRPTSSALRPVLTPNNSSPTGRTPLREAPAGSVSLSWSMFPAKVPGVVLAVLARSGSVSYCLI